MCNINPNFMKGMTRPKRPKTQKDQKDPKDPKDPKKFICIYCNELFSTYA